MPPSEDDAHFAEDGTFPRHDDRSTTIVHPSISNDHTLTGSPATAVGGGGSLTSPHRAHLRELGSSSESFFC